MSDFIRGVLGEMKDGGEMRFGQPQFDRFAPQGQEHRSQDIGMQQIVELLYRENLLYPGEAFLGFERSGIPVYWDVCDPVHSGPLLAVGSDLRRARSLLDTVVRFIPQAYTSEHIEIAGILTSQPDSWQECAQLAQCPVFAFSQTAAEDFVLSVASATTHRHRNTKIVVLDGLEYVPGLNFDGRQNVRWLLQNGPEHRVYVVAAASAKALAEHYDDLALWRGYFPHVAAGNVPERLCRSLDIDPRGETLPYGAFVLPHTQPFMTLISG